MTTLIVSPHVRQLHIAVVAEPDLRANIRDSQAAGELAYQAAEAAGLSLPERADAYHYTFVESMAGLGTPMCCHCDHCQPEGSA